MSTNVVHIYTHQPWQIQVNQATTFSVVRFFYQTSCVRRRLRHFVETSKVQSLDVYQAAATLCVVIVINDYNMTRDIEELYNDDKIDDSCSENDIVINEAIETLHLMCECTNIINWLWHVNNDIKLRIPNCKVKLMSSGSK